MSDWISVKDALPEDDNDVLAVAFVGEGWNVHFAWHDREEKAWRVNLGIGYSDEIPVSHWMPLPELPEED